MLLRNESKVKHSIEIKLVFDDNTSKELEIHSGDCVKVSYRRNGCVKCGVGVIRHIMPNLKKYCNNKIVESATIVIDMSEENAAFVCKIDLDDILDISLAYPNCPCHNVQQPPKEQHHCCHANCQHNSEPVAMCPCENVVTDEEVVE